MFWRPQITRKMISSVRKCNIATDAVWGVHGLLVPPPWIRHCPYTNMSPLRFSFKKFFQATSQVVSLGSGFGIDLSSGIKQLRPPPSSHPPTRDEIVWRLPNYARARLKSITTRLYSFFYSLVSPYKISGRKNTRIPVEHVFGPVRTSKNNDGLHNAFVHKL